MVSIGKRLHRWWLDASASQPVDRGAESPVSPTDSLIVARFIACSVLALYTYSFDDGAASTQLALVVLVFALLQPVLPLLGSDQAAYRHVSIISDVVAFFVFVLVGPTYFWLCLAVVASVVANYAVLTSMRRYVPVAALSVAVVAVAGILADIDRFERAVGVLIILAIGHGYMGFRTRVSMSEARADVLQAVRAAGGVAHIADLESGRIVDVAGEIDRIVGWTREQWMSMDLFEIIHPDDIGDFWVDLERVEVGDS